MLKVIKDYVVSTVLWAAGLAWAVPTMMFLTLYWKLSGKRNLEWFVRLQCRGQVAFTGNTWRAIVHPDVDPHTPYVFMQNHTNHLDYGVLAWAVPGHRLQGMELEKHFNYPVYGWFMKARGTIPVRVGEKQQLERLLECMRDRVSQGDSILMFPEGTRTLDGRVGRFRKGGFYLAWELGVPIVPVAVTGMYDVMRKGSLLIRPGHQVTVHVGKPIPTRGLQRRELGEVARLVKQTITTHVDQYWESRSLGEVE